MLKQLHGQHINTLFMSVHIRIGGKPPLYGCAQIITVFASWGDVFGDLLDLIETTMPTTLLNCCFANLLEQLELWVLVAQGTSSRPLEMAFYFDCVRANLVL